MKNFFSKLKKLWFSFSLRMKLLWIWLIKNIGLFIKIAVFICIALVMFGYITEDTPLLGALFGTLSQHIKEAMEDANVESLGGVGISLSTIAFSTYMFLAKTKSIALSDIKSRKLKIALIRANLYFNENGHLCKRLEKATSIDLDGDGKIADVNVEDLPQENIVKGTARALGELATVLTAKIDTSDEAKKVLEDAKLKDTKESLDDIHNDEDPNLTSDTISTAGTIAAVAATTVVANENKGKIKTFFGNIGNKIKTFFSSIISKIKSAIEKNKKELATVKKESAEIKVKETTITKEQEPIKVIEDDVKIINDEIVQTPVVQQVVQPIVKETEKVVEVKSEPAKEEPKVQETKTDVQTPIVKKPRVYSSSARKIEEIFNEMK